MANFSNILKKAGAVVLAAGGLILAGKSQFGKNFGITNEEKDMTKLEPLGEPAAEEKKEDTMVPLEEKEEDGE